MKVLVTGGSGLIGRANINIEEMENVIYQGTQAACAKIRLDADLPESALNRIRDGIDVRGTPGNESV